MDTMHPETMRVATEELPVATAVADLREELSYKRKQVQDKKARLDGGFSPIIQRDYKAIDVEIADIKVLVEIKKIERDNFVPLRPEWKYQEHSRWLEINTMKIQEIVNDLEAHLNILENQKKTINFDIAQLEARILILNKLINDWKGDEEVKITPVKDEPAEDLNNTAA